MFQRYQPCRGSTSSRTPVLGLCAVNESHLEPRLEVRGRRPSPLCYAATPGGDLVHRPLAASTVRHICRRRADQGELAPFSPHDLGRSCATELFDQDVDLATVSRMLGHSELERPGNMTCAPNATRRAGASSGAREPSGLGGDPCGSFPGREFVGNAAGAPFR